MQTRFMFGGVEYVVVSVEERRDPPAPLAGLSTAEREVMALLADGLPSDEIARQRQRSIRTVEHQIEAIFRKLGVRCRGELIARLAQRG